MAETLIVHRDGAPIYPIILTDSYRDLKENLIGFGLGKRRVCIVTETTVAPLYLDTVKQIFEEVSSQVTTFVFPAGEPSKTLDTVRSLYEHLILHAFDRNDMLVALGGGVTGDLTGYAAATYLRGIDFIQMPTTLLSQVDSSIGGKTGVDFDQYKNMVGAFHMPKLVYINAATLTTLSAEQFSSGMGEVIKHGCIRDRAYYDWIAAHKEEIQARDLSALLHVVSGSCRIKRAVVEEDPTEKGIRGILNFGHTLGHAIEKEMHFGLSHGACVGIGCAAAGWLSAKRGLISEADLFSMEAMLTAFGIPTTISGLSVDSVMEAVKHDKKMASGNIKFILLHAIGDAFIDRTVSFEEMEAAFGYILT